jgi:adenosine deaminase
MFRAPDLTRIDDPSPCVLYESVAQVTGATAAALAVAVAAATGPAAPAAPAFDPATSELPLVTGFGLAATEKGFPGKPYDEFLRAANKAGMIVQPHAGEEWHDGACRNILGAIEAGATRIGHGIHAICTPVECLPEDAKARLSELEPGAVTLCGLMKEKGVTVEICLTSNLAIKSVACGRYDGRPHPLRLLLDAGVDCVLGSDDSGMWGAGKGTCLSEECRLALALGATRAELAKMMSHAFTISRAVPEAAKEGLVAACDAWAKDQTADLASLPKADMHSHLNGALPAWWIEQNKGALEASPVHALRGVAACSFGGASAADSGGGGGADADSIIWEDLDDFRRDYDKRGAIVKNAGVASLVPQILAVAKDCQAANVRLVELSVTPWGDHDVFLRWCAEGRRQAWACHQVYVSFVVTAIRVMPPEHEFAGGAKYLDSATRFCGCCAASKQGWTKGWTGTSSP